MSNPALVDLPAERRAELADAFGADDWEEIPLPVRNNFRTPDVDLEGFLEAHTK